MTRQVILAVDEEKLPEGATLQDVVVARQISYFADYEGACGLVKYFDDESKGRYFAMIANRFTKNNPREPFDTRPDLEPSFKDLIMRMMNVDPNKRLTAKEALSHPWFADVD